MEQHAQRGFRARIGQSVAPFDPPTIRTLKPHAFAIDRPQVATVDLLVGTSTDDGAGQSRRKPVEIPLLKPPPHVTIDLLTLARARALGTRDPGIILRRQAVVGETYQPTEQRAPASNEPVAPRPLQSRTRGGVNNGKVNLFSLLWPVLQPSLGSLGQEMPDLPHPLKPWQITDVRFLANTPRAMLGDDMGLGKTIQAIVALRLLFRLGHIGSMLLLCPKSILRNWQREVQKWAPELTSVIVAGSRIE